MTEHRRDNDAPKADRAYRKWKDGLSTGLVYIDTYREAIQVERPTLTGITLRCDPDDDKGVLGVVKGYVGSTWYVAFHRADTVALCVSEIGNRMRNGSLKWREDTPYVSK